jgi:hypothetical protein
MATIGEAWLKIAPEGTPSRLEVEASCEVVYAHERVSWPSWSPLEALWAACLSQGVCRQARMCRRQRMRRAQIRAARYALAHPRDTGA